MSSVSIDTSAADERSNWTFLCQEFMSVYSASNSSFVLEARRKLQPSSEFLSESDVVEHLSSAPFFRTYAWARAMGFLIIS